MGQAGPGAGIGVLGVGAQPDLTQVLYRKWRPRKLADVVGQGHVTRTLSQAVLQGRVAHAYLFSGPRGTGKTSTARILAKAMNCPNSTGGEPCGECAFCIAVDESRALDIVEIDAASQRRIDDIRDLREKVHFTPAEATYKVYIVDEVHMLTAEAFNALLKTLEEPPGHAVFILATTEAHRVPATVISRCQRFDFHRISNSDIEGRLAHICEVEGFSVGPNVLSAVASNSSGSLRDAENLLEQLAISFGSSLAMSNVRELLGVGDDQHAIDLVGYILRGDTREGLGAIARVADQGLDLRRFHRQVVDYLRGVMLLKVGVESNPEHTPEAVESLGALARDCTLDRALRVLRLFEQAWPKADGPATLPLELALVECAVVESAAEPAPSRVAAPAAPAPAPRPAVSAPPPRPVAQPTEAKPVAPREEPAMEESQPPAAPQPAPVVPPEVAQATPVEASAEPVLVSGELPDAWWNDLRKAAKGIKVNKFKIDALLFDCVTRRVEEDTLVLGFKTRPNMERLEQELENPQTRRLLQEAVAQVTGTPYAVRLHLASESGPGSAGPKGHLIRQARQMGAQFGKEEEETSHE